MTLTLDLPAADEAALRDEAARDGQAPDDWARDALSEVLRTRRASNGTNGSNGRHAPAHHALTHEETREERIARRLAAIDALPTCDTRAGWPELDLSGARADVYGYSEREAEQL